jgi:hypothetical protein
VISKALAHLIMVLSTATMLAGANVVVCAIFSAQTEAILTLSERRSIDASRSNIEDLIQSSEAINSIMLMNGSMLKMIGNLLDAGSFDKRRQEANLKSILVVEPASGSDWLRLAKARAELSVSEQEAYSAVDMSELTEPREFDMLVGRAAYYLTIWEALPKERQMKALKELSDAAPFLDVQGMRQMKSALDMRPDSSRKAIKGLLIARERGEKPWMKAIGL